MPVQFLTGRDGLRLAADVTGDDALPTVIMMHGGGQTRHSWAAAPRQIAAQGYHVINFDARGHGESEWSQAGSYSVAARTEDLMSIVERLNKPVVALVGASMGGVTAMSAVANGYRPSALVVIDIVPDPEPAGVQKIRDFMRANLDGFSDLEEAVTAVRKYNPNRPPTGGSGLARNLRQGEDGRLYWHWDPRILDNIPDPEQHSRLISGLSKAVDVPTLLIRGGISDVVTADAAARFQASVPHLELLEVGGAGHMVAGDRNDIFTQGAIDFLACHAPTQNPTAQ